MCPQAFWGVLYACSNGSFTELKKNSRGIISVLYAQGGAFYALLSLDSLFWVRLF